MWSPYDGKQTGDPAKLGAALVALSQMSDPPAVFAGGADALAAINTAIEARLNDMRSHDALSRSTDLV